MNLTTLLTCITPSMFASRFAQPGSIKGARATCYLPGLGTVSIQSCGFTMGTRFCSGNIVDVLVVMGAEGSAKVTYHEAVRVIAETFKDMLPADMLVPTTLDVIATEAMLRRRIFNAVVCRRNPGIADLSGRLGLKALSLFGKDLDLSWGMGGCLSAAEMLELHKRLRDAGHAVELKRAPAVVIPYYANVCELAALDIIYATSRETIWLGNHKFGFTGLPLFHEEDEFFLELNFTDAYRSACYSREENLAATSMLHNPQGVTVSWLPKRICYVDRDLPLGILTPALLVKHGVPCIVTQTASIEGTARLGSLLWGEAVLAAVTEILLREKEFSSKVLLLLETVRGDGVIKASLRSALQEQGEYWLASQLDSILREGIIWEGAAGSIFTTAAGYLFEVGASAAGEGELISNFTILPLHTVRHDTGEVYYAMRVSVGDERRDIMVGATAFDTVKRLAEAIQQAVGLCGNPTTIVPMMFDTSRGRMIIVYAIKAFSTLPVRHGVSFLGWSGPRTSFTGPDFKCSGEAVSYGTSVFRPGVDYFKYFSATDDITPRQSSVRDVPVELLTVVHQCAGIIARSYTNHELRPVAYLNDATTRRVLERLFACIGQPRILQLNQNMRNNSALDCLQGYPFLGVGYNSNQAKAVKSGFILLGEEGATIPEMQEHEIISAGRLMRFVLEMLPCWLIENYGSPAALSHGVVDPEILAIEGAACLDQILSK